jgi:hypothetical protein
MPVSVAAVGAALTAVQLARELRGRASAVADEDEPDAPAQVVWERVRRSALYLGSLGAYVAATWFVGIVWASALWSLWFLRRVARLSWAASLAYTAGLVVGLQVLASVLGLYLPRGRLGL